MSSVYEIPGSPLEKLAVLTQMILDEGNSGFFMLVHQARTSDNVPAKARESVEQYSQENKGYLVPNVKVLLRLITTH